MKTPPSHFVIFLLLLTVTIFGLTKIGNRPLPLVQAQTSGLIASYSFDSNSSDSSPSNNNGTLIGSPSFTQNRTGQASSALSLNGINQYVSIPDSNSLDLTTSLTVSAWINPNTIATGRGILSKWGATAGTLSYAFATDWMNLHNEFYLALDDDGATQGDYFAVSSGASLLPNQWTHIAAVYNGSSITLYKNGQVVNQTLRNIQSIPTSLYQGTAPLIIGSSNGAETWSGALDEVKLYNRALSLSEIQTLAGVTPPPAGGQTCTNNIIEGTEVCSGTNLNGQSCSTQGYSSGTLSCNSSCTGFVTGGCTPPAGGGEGGQEV